MSIFRSLGHIVASFGIGIFDAFTGRPTNGSIAEAVGAGAGNLLGIALPEARPLVNASVTCFGDFVQAVKQTGADVKAGDKITIVVSDALASSSKVVWPDVEKVLSAFESAIGGGPSAPAHG